MNHQTLLIELGTEELPPKNLLVLAKAFQHSLANSLAEAQIIESTTDTRFLATPRRLAFMANNAVSKQADQAIERKGPAVKSAFKDDGSPSPALLGFAKSCGANIDDLEKRETEKGEWLFFKQTVAGKPITEIVQAALDKAIKALPIAKRMRWGASNTEFVRPVHWLVAMHGNSVLEIEALALKASNTSKGHRFHSDKHNNGEIIIASADDYQQTLLTKGNVSADYNERKADIKAKIDALAKSVGGFIEDDEDLLNEVTSLVEYAKPIIGNIDERFMSVPQESLISSMRDHQKYFHVVDDNGKLLPHFITVSNIESSDENRVRFGNERVLRARLSDAEFFWETDKKTTLIDRIPTLENVLYHIKLGSLANKVSRLETIAFKLADLFGADKALSARAAKLAKADLNSNMVGEFSDLQGIMGKYYAQFDGEDTIVADAIEQHYWPKFAGDKLPKTNVAQVVSIADKLDSLVGIHGVGEIPTGDKDPYALRRASLGILNILTSYNHALKLSDLVSIAANTYKQQGIDINTTAQAEIISFIQGRYKPYYQSRNYGTALINAVAASGMNSPVDFAARIAALDVFEDYPEAKDLAAANKRIGNILKKIDNTNALEGSIDTTLLEAGAEQNLANAIDTVAADASQFFDNGDYEQGLQKLAILRDPIDAFFDNVMVMTDDEAIKTNRLKLLKKLQGLFLRVADLSIL